MIKQVLSNMGSNHGGKRQGAGRPSKAEEFKLIEKLDAVKSPKWVIDRLFDHIEEGNFKAVELYMGYRFGKPKQTHDHSNNGGSFDNNPIVVFKSE